ncbi:S8 family serine peptidase [Agromyces atrinae]|uniref:LPXTG cell wall anchor domain-containing protein n=1 Tax=Agromyces atrinae TaxID=592376 RepID=A0A4Q2M4J9_9MICO|nr:S8 family serine peptidase [Agromyces atrinae]NYD67411.1 LPXTG-motif cell wall-anchored protein [Agromyces atrinae]RXZ86768.1 LPXTG cell wall anchor domain-containing protein [Agromyces atrinae]
MESSSWGIAPRRAVRSSFVGAVALGAVLFLAGPVSPAAAELEPDDRASLSGVVERLAGTLEDPSTDEFAASEGLPADGILSLQVDDAGRLAVSITTDGADVVAVSEAVAALGLVVAVDPEHATLTAFVAPSELDALSRLAGVTSVSHAPQAGSGSFAAAAADDILPIPTGTCRSIPADAAIPLNVVKARSDFGVDGGGVTVGIISNSFALKGGPEAGKAAWDADVRNGLLPGPGNPCGYLEPVIVHDLPTTVAGQDDEGRGMAQLVHAMAPGAKLAFATGITDETAMRAAIDQLIADGADIIVDDVLFPTEPYFQESLLTQKIDRLVDAGLVYLTAAGNFNQVAEVDGEVRPIGSWMSAEYRPIDCPDGIAAASGLEGAVDCMDFDPSEAEAYSNAFTVIGVPDGDDLQVEVLAQWALPYGTEFGDFSLVVTDPAGTPVEVSELQLGFPGLGVVISGASTEPTAYDFFIVRAKDRTDARPAVRISSVENGLPAVFHSLEYDTTQGDDVVGPTVNGHNGARKAITVAAAPFTEPTGLEYFSSLGPVYTGLPPIGSETVLPFAELETYSKPDILSLDGERNSVLSAPPGSSGGVYQFFGTSAASPTAAGVVALGLQAHPGLTPDEVKAALFGSAIPRGATYVGHSAENTTGAGLIDAYGYLSRVAELPVPPEPNPAAPAQLPSTGIDPTTPALVGLFAFLAGAVLLRRRVILGR